MPIHKGPVLYRTSDGRIVPEGDPGAAFLVVAPGGQVPPEYAADVAAYTEGAPAEAQAEKRKPAEQATKRGGPQENK